MAGTDNDTWDLADVPERDRFDAPLLPLRPWCESSASGRCGSWTRWPSRTVLGARSVR
jgi:hypothetical protein